jgi:drug/metabolite transporter (DMT)-like permease
MRSFVLLFAVLSLTVYGQLIIKARTLVHNASAAAHAKGFGYLTAMLSDVGVLSGLAAAALAALLWVLAIQRLDVGFAYPFMALSFVFVPLGAKLLLAEPLPPIQILGMALIGVGVTVSALSR